MFADGKTIYLRPKSGEDGIQVIPDGGVKLYSDNSLKFQTNSNGCRFVGMLAGIDNEKVALGTGNDLQIYHDGSHSYLNNLTGSLQVQDAGTEKFRVSGTGTFFKDDIFIANDNDKINIGAGNDLQIYHNGSNTFIDNSTGVTNIRGGTHKFRKLSDNEDMLILNPNSSVDLYFDNSKKLETLSTGAKVTGRLGLEVSPATAVEIKLDAFAATGNDDASDWGAGGIFQLLHSGTAAANNEVLLLGAVSGAVGQIACGFGFGRESTSNWGTYISFKTHSTSTANIDELIERWKITSAGHFKNNSDSIRIKLGASDDLEIYHDGSHSYIQDNGTGNLKITSNGTAVQIESSTGENMAVFRTDGAVELYHDNTQRFTTSNAGVGIAQSGDKLTWPASSGAGPEIYNAGSSVRDLQFNIDNEHKYTLHQNGIFYQKGANSSAGGAYSSPAPSYPVRVWLSFNDEDNITNGHGGVSSVSDTGTGTFTINFSDTWPDDNYAMAATSGGAGGSRGDDSCITHGATNPGTGSIGIRTRKFTDNNFTNSESAMFVFVR